MSRWSEADAAAFLARQGFALHPGAVTRMAGGLWNDVMRVDLPDGPLVLKHYAQVLEGTLFPNLPEAEAAALERLRGLQVAPDPVGFWADEAVLLYRYVGGAPWQDDSAAVADLLRRKEAADPSGFRSLPLIAADLLADADRMFDRCRQQGLVRDWRAVRPMPVALPPPGRLSLVHTDIGAGNLIGMGAALRLIDWQCPGAGDLAEDVFTFLSPSFQIVNHRPPLAQAAVARFFDRLAMPDTERRYRALRPCYAYRMAAYCCLRMETAPEAEIRQLYDRACRAELAELAEVR